MRICVFIIVVAICWAAEAIQALSVLPGHARLRVKRPAVLKGEPAASIPEEELKPERLDVLTSLENPNAERSTKYREFLRRSNSRVLLDDHQNRDGGLRYSWSAPTANIPLQDSKGQALFTELLVQQGERDRDYKQNNVLQLFRYLETQMNLGACAAASSVTVLNALNYKRPYDPTYTPYLGEGNKFWTQNAFSFDPCVSKIFNGHVFGQTLEALGQVYKCMGLQTDVQHGDGSPAFSDKVRKHLALGHYVIANYDRTGVDQKGGGHFSPIAGYVQEGYYLVMDVARYRYPPVFVPYTNLVKAMSTIDAQSGMKRGFIAVWTDKK